MYRAKIGELILAACRKADAGIANGGQNVIQVGAENPRSVIPLPAIPVRNEFHERERTMPYLVVSGQCGFMPIPPLVYPRITGTSPNNRISLTRSEQLPLSSTERLDYYS
ncbi:hypothetical protein MAR_015847 [Mya arenaria]|uniref:Uncharacterized protein n=1 Tax=Mya arenaria TaxID=6604 RepID=A0ABY7FI65_MYAAR|nr:hypothetical protein MAR_015847 [Mya arenaria]